MEENTTPNPTGGQKAGTDEVYLIHRQHHVQRCTLKKRKGGYKKQEAAQNVYVNDKYIGFIIRPYKHTHEAGHGGVYDYKYQFHSWPTITDPVIVYVSPLEATLRAINGVEA